MPCAGLGIKSRNSRDVLHRFKDKGSYADDIPVDYRTGRCGSGLDGGCQGLEENRIHRQTRHDGAAISHPGSGWAGSVQLPLICFGLGIIFSLAGDIFLLLSNRWFIAGLVAFLLAHVVLYYRVEHTTWSCATFMGNYHRDHPGVGNCPGSAGPSWQGCGRRGRGSW